MRISYLSSYKNLDIKNWSGLDYFIAKALERQNLELSYLFTENLHYSKESKCKSLLYKLTGKHYDYKRSFHYAKAIASFASAQLKSDTQVIFSPSSIPLALLDTQIPKVLYTDATFAGMIGFYEGFSNLCAETINDGNYIEQEALSSSILAIYSSDWAAKTAIENYNLNPDKVKVVPFGANIEHSLSFNNIKDIVHTRSKQKCNLLFLGVDWKRKGAELAIRVAAQLNKLGLKTELHLAGLPNIDNDRLPDFVINYGFIDKNTENGKNLINNLFSLSHFLIVPSRAEAYGLVYCEANSYGVPAIATNVGGIPIIIKDDVNGKMFSLLDTEEKYAEYIYNAFIDFEKYKEFAYSSYNEYAKRLNWSVAGKAISELIKSII